MSKNSHDYKNLKPKRKNRPLPKKALFSGEKNPTENIITHSRILAQVDTNSQIIENQPSNTMITRNRITTQTGIFNMAKVSKTVSRGPLSTQIDTSMMDQDPPICETSMVSRVINQSQLVDHSVVNQEHSLMDISKSIPTPEFAKLPLRRSSIQNHLNQTFASVSKLGPSPAAQSEDQPDSQEIPFKEIEHNLIHGIKSGDYFKTANTLVRVKRDLHATIKRNIPHEVYLQFFKQSVPPQPQNSSILEKKVMPLQPSHLENLPKGQLDRKLSEWTMLMGTFSSQEDEDNSLSFKAESKSNATNMMDTDIPISQSVVGYESSTSKPDYLDSPSPVTMYPHKMF